MRGAYLRDDILLGEADDQAIFRRVVLVLVLDGETLTCIVVGLALTTSLELRLEALEVGAVFHYLDETHGCPRSRESLLKSEDLVGWATDPKMQR